MADQHPFRIFRPVGAPPWLPHVLSSVEGLFRRVLPTWLRLHDIETAGLPTASAENKAGIAFDKTVNRPTYSDGSSWITLAAYDADVAAYAALSTTGLVVRTGAGTVATRTITGPAAGVSVSNGDGVSGNPTLALANDLSAVEALSGTGIARRTGADAWSVGTTVAVAEGGTGGTAASGTLLDNITGFSSTGHLVRTGSGTYAFRTITGTANQITVTNGDGVSAAPTLSLPSAVTMPGTLAVTGETTCNADLNINGATATARFLRWQTSGVDVSYIALGGDNVSMFYNGASGGTHVFQINGTTEATVTTSGLNLASGNVLQVNGTQVVGARGAALPADATDLASVIALANAIKARVKATGGHGLVAD